MSGSEDKDVTASAPKEMADSPNLRKRRSESPGAAAARAGNSEKHKHPSFKVIYLTVFLDFFANGVVLPVLQSHAQGLGASGFNVGLVFTAYSAAQIPGSFLFGRLSDLWGRRPIILISLVMSTVTLLFTLAAPDLNTLVIARAIAGFFSETSVCQAYIADKTTRENRPTAMGHMGAFIGLGFTVGPATGALLGLFGGFSLAVKFTVVVTALNLVYAYLKLDESLGYVTGEISSGSNATDAGACSWGAYFAILLRPAICLAFAGQFLITFAFMGWDTTFGLWARDRLGYTQRHTGWAFAWLALGHFLASWKMRKFAKDPARSASGGLIGCALMSAGLLAHRLVYSTFPMLPPLFGIGFGYALSELVFQTLVSVHSPKELQGTMLGSLTSVQALARAVAPMVTGHLFDISAGDHDFAYTALALTTGVAAMIVLAVYALIARSALETKSAKAE